MNKILSIILIVVLSGCAARMNSSNENFVNISNTHMFNLHSAVSMAEKECAKYGKQASYAKAEVGVGYIKFTCFD
tara:strand:- start:95 stop:319 length:225 start_codon:yes stop_codon:yes gene_type:complete